MIVTKYPNTVTEFLVPVVCMNALFKDLPTKAQMVRLDLFYHHKAGYQKTNIKMPMRLLGSIIKTLAFCDEAELLFLHDAYLQVRKMQKHRRVNLNRRYWEKS